LAIPGIRTAITAKHVVAVSPIIDGGTVKGPAAKICTELGLPPTPVTVALHYNNLLSGFILDNADSNLVQLLTIPTKVTNILMKNQDDRRRLAEDVLNLVRTL
jgi:LPPG:FO 2-phospho-L-lactate transferase